ncbi:hypothetical protein ACF0H5_018904 [Mactra antiquata]
MANNCEVDDQTISQLLNTSQEMENKDLFAQGDSDRVGYSAGTGQWTSNNKKSKRKRMNTGSVDYQSYESISPDEKLNVLFNKIQNIESGYESTNLKMSSI